jgi:ATP-binding protein involved in chromosome partitioning
MKLTSERIEECLREVLYPGFQRDVVSFGMVRRVDIDGDLVTLGLHVSTGDEQTKTKVFTDCVDACLRAGAGRVEIDDLSVPPPGATPEPLGASGTTCRGIPGVETIVAVASGKGGVGKSMVAVNLAQALAMQGQRVGILDADVFGPSVPTMLGLSGTLTADAEGRLIPLQADLLRVMSIGLILEEDKPAIWRGPMVMQVLEQFLHKVDWGELDTLVVDLPPGTGDAQLTLVQQVPLSGGLIVTTPQEVALADVRRGIRMFREVEVPVLGVIENMAWYTCPDCGRTEEIFDRGGGQRAAERYRVPFLGEIPIDTRIRACSDEGEPFVQRHPDSEAARCLFTIARNMVRAATLAAEA